MRLGAPYSGISTCPASLPRRRVKKSGLSVGEMQAKLIAKIEELTLYMIQEHEPNGRLLEQNRELREQNADLLRRFARLEAK